MNFFQKPKRICGFLFLIVCVITGCATTPKAYSWKDVGRIVEPTESSSSNHAYLQVYTKIKEHSALSADIADRYFAYLPYTIYSSDGNVIKHVESNETNKIEEPPLIELPPGKYVIVPDGLFPKSCIVGVIIKEGKKTVVRMT